MSTVQRLRQQIYRHRVRERVLQQRINSQCQEINTLRASLRCFVEAQQAVDVDLNGLYEDEAGIDEDDGGPSAVDEDDGGPSAVDEDVDMQAEDEDNDEVPDPLWLEQELIYVCTECAGELEDGICAFCGLEHTWDYDDPQAQSNSIAVDSDAFSDDRYPVERGTTPLLPLDDIDRARAPLPEGWPESRRSEYIALRERGAPHGMCSLFALSYSPSGGIIARIPVDTELRADFQGPEMADDDVWKVQLGRRLKVEDGDQGKDPDGVQFMEGLLEDALLSPLRLEQHVIPWETVRDLPYSGRWITRPKPLAQTHDDGDDSSQIEYDAICDEDNDECVDRDDPQSHVKTEVDAKGVDRYDVFHGHIPDNIYGWSNSDALYDAALKRPERTPACGPVIEVDDYESDTPSMDEGDVESSDEYEEYEEDELQNDGELVSVTQPGSSTEAPISVTSHGVEPNAAPTSVSDSGLSCRSVTPTDWATRADVPDANWSDENDAATDSSDDVPGSDWDTDG